MQASEIRAALECGNPSCACHRARGTNTHCPAHDDRDPSLSVRDGASAPLVKCMTGCDASSVIEALKGRGLWDEPGESRSRNTRQSREPVQEYRYVDATGNLVGIKGRFEWTEDGERKKSFLWKRAGETRWSGLGDAGVESMPLYNLGLLIDKPNDPVFVTEGEKAATALVNRGKVAVCLSGGASQRRFGDALNPLRDREVILWPDNDAPGEGLMGRIAASLPQAAFIRPVVPPKGDAYDYFEGGGTLEALNDLYQSGDPDVEVVSPTSVSVTLHQPGGDVRFDFTEMSQGPRSLDCHMEISTYLRRIPYRTRLNISSHSARQGIVSELNNVYDFDPRGKDTPWKWAALLSEATNLAEEAWKGIDRSVALADVELVTVREWFVDGLCPRKLLTIPFGMGGSTKSLVWGVLLPLCAMFDRKFFGIPVAHAERVLILDYEDAESEWRLRFEEVAKGMGITLTEDDLRRVRYMPGSGIALAEQGESIRRRHLAEPFELLIVDSCISAVGGDLLDTSAAQRLVNWLTTFGNDYDVTSIMLAHSTKGDDDKAKMYPYGNIFWHNLPRSTVYVEAIQEPGSRELAGQLRPRKASRGSQRPVHYEVTFPESDGGGTVFKALASEHPAFQQTKSGYDMTVKEAIVATVINAGGNSVSYEGIKIGVERMRGKETTIATIRTKTGELVSDGTLARHESDGKLFFGLRSRRDDEPPF